MALVFSDGTSPINFNVMCAPSVRTHRALRHAGRNFTTSAAAAARTSAGMSSATKTRTRSTLRARLGGVEEVPAHHVECDLRGHPADAVAVTGEEQGALFAACRIGERDVHGAHRFFRRPSGRPCNPSDAGTECRAGAPPDSI